MSGSSKAGHLKAGLLAELRARIAACETPRNSMGEALSGPPSLRFGAASVASLGAPFDAALPGGGLRRNALHEIAAADYRDMGAGAGFVAALTARLSDAVPSAPVLWCEGGHGPFDAGGLYGPGLAAFGLAPERLILAAPARDGELLWTLEEALKLGAFAAVVGEIDGRTKALDLVATRRLQLVAEEGATPLLLFTGHESADASVAVTRWRIAAAPGGPGPRLEGQSTELLGRPRWRVALERCRGAESGGSWLVEWNAVERSFGEVDGEKAIRREPVAKLRLVG